MKLILTFLAKFILTLTTEKAVRGILDFYNAYISKVCLRPCYHANGTVNMQVDEELKGRIHTEMMKAILRFEIREK